jgi:hypothetical protein
VSLTNNQIPQSGGNNVLVQNNGNKPICAVFKGNRTQNPGAGNFNFSLQSGVQPFRVVDLPNLSANNNGATSFQFDAATPVPPFAATIGNFTTVTSCP